MFVSFYSLFEFLLSDVNYAFLVDGSFYAFARPIRFGKGQLQAKLSYSDGIFCDGKVTVV